MKNYESIMMALEICAEESADRCDECPYVGKCRELRTDAARLIEELVDRLEHPTTACDYEATSHKLGEELERVEIENERIQRELSEAQKELAYLRAVKATTEAFLGVKI